jgi:hypothetical protein
MFNKNRLNNDKNNNKKLVQILNKKIFRGFIKIKKLNELKNKNSPLILNTNKNWENNKFLPFEDFYNITYEKTYLNNNNNEKLNSNVNSNFKINKIDAKEILDKPIVKNYNNFKKKYLNDNNKVQTINASTQTIFKFNNYNNKLKPVFIKKNFHKVINQKDYKFNNNFSNIYNYNNKLNDYKNNKINFKNNFYSTNISKDEKNELMKDFEDDSNYLNFEKLYYTYDNNNKSSNKKLNSLKKRKKDLFNKKINLKVSSYDSLTKEFNRKKKQFENHHKLFFNTKINNDNLIKENNNNIYYLKTEISSRHNKKFIL